MEKSLVDINESIIKRFIESKRPNDPEIRKQIDLGYSYDGKTAFLFTLRPYWLDPNKILRLEFAKIRFYRSRKEWYLYWKRGNGKWEPYGPYPKSSHLGKLLDLINDDKHACFFG